MIVGIDQLIEAVEQNDIKNFEVRSSQGDSNTTQLRTSDDQTHDQKINLLRSVMSNNYGKFYLIGYDSQTQNKGRIAIEFLIREDVKSPSYAPSVAGMVAPEGYVSKSEVQQMIDNVKLSNQVSNLEKDLADLKKEKKELEAPVNEFFRNLAPIASALVAGFMKKGAVAPVPASIGEMDADEEMNADEVVVMQQRVQDLLQRWLQNDRDAIDLIEKIVNLCETNRVNYDMAKGMLNNM